MVDTISKKLVQNYSQSNDLVVDLMVDEEEEDLKIDIPVKGDVMKVLCDTLDCTKEIDFEEKSNDIKDKILLLQDKKLFQLTYDVEHLENINASLREQMVDLQDGIVSGKNIKTCYFLQNLIKKYV